MVRSICISGVYKLYYITLYGIINFINIFGLLFQYDKNLASAKHVSVQISMFPRKLQKKYQKLAVICI